jgi:hypothetical protein
MPNATEREKNYVLPIETPPEKVDEMAKVVSEFQMKQKEASKKEKEKKPSSGSKEHEKESTQKKHEILVASMVIEDVDIEDQS